ncbi:MFS transporter [Streptomyces scopuliridis]|uniref:MFS transporter n=1 Tax=Streptomyces scopuliridis TaxID=452529 RepID=A0ACD4ZZ28_9ACTN|nr:MFS transporter [Streptomyces scopuliridis]WSC02347.1 MFS transporter [Streptomyces scopuliridis]WSC04116.1 MFS transporter [Streptomyces scopuliridis]
MTGPLAHPAFRNMARGRTAGFFGNGMAPVALAFAVLDLTGSVTQLGLVVGVRSVAAIVTTTFGGVLADRFPRRLLLQSTSFGAAVTQAVAGLTLLGGVASVQLLMLLSALNGALAAVELPTTTALVSQTVPGELLRRANALLRTFTSVATLCGAAGGSLVIGWAGPSWGILVDSASFAVAGLFFGRVRVGAVVHASARGSMIGDLREGWSEFARHRWLWTVVLHASVWQLVWAGSVQVIGPAVAEAGVGARTWGLVLAAQTLGAIAGGLLALHWKPRAALATGVLLTSVSAALPWALAAEPQPALLIPAAFLTGVAMEQVNIALTVAVQERIAPGQLARVTSYQVLGSLAAVPFGQLLAGPLSAAYGQGHVLVAAGACIVAVTLAALAVPDVRTTGRATPVCRSGSRRYGK